MSFPNYTVDGESEGTDKESYAVIELVFKSIGLPIVSGFGIIANILNLVVLSKQTLVKSFSKTTSAHVCILALSVADLGVCLFAFPYGIISKSNQDVFMDINFHLYYPKIADVAVNAFMTSSTWIVVILACERYVAVCHPLRVKEVVTFPRTVAAVVTTFVTSLGLCLPKGWWLDIVSVYRDNTTQYTLDKGDIRNDKTFAEAYILVLRIVQNYIPLVLITILNIRLVYELRRTYSRRMALGNGHTGISQDASTQKLNLTLVGVIVIYLVLVAPSEIYKLIHSYGKLHLSQKADYGFKIAKDITNFMQIINYSINFFWYCFALSTFRHTLRHPSCVCVRGCGCCFSRRRHYSSVTSSTQEFQVRRPGRSVTGSQSSATSQEAYV